MSTSGWRDSNPRPRAPKARALAKLRYSPSRPRIIGTSAAPSTVRRSQAATNPIPATPLSRVAARASSQCNGSLVKAAHTAGDGSLGHVAEDGCDGIRGGGVLFVHDLHVACCSREIPVTEPVPHTLQVHPLVDEP